MAAKKMTEMPPEPEPELVEDVIVLKKSLVVNIGVAALFFVLGALTSYFLFVLPNRALEAAQAQQPAGAAQQAQPTQPPTRLSNVGVGKLPPLGPSSAPVKIVEFSDFQCPFCKNWNDSTFGPLRQKYGDKIAVYYRHYPLTSIHPEAMKGANAAECANEQGKFWDMHDGLFRTQSVIGVDNSKSLAAALGLDAQKFNDCIDNNKYQANIDADVADGDAYGVSGTPTFFINGVRLVGALPINQFTAVIDQELNK